MPGAQLELTSDCITDITVAVTAGRGSAAMGRRLSGTKPTPILRCAPRRCSEQHSHEPYAVSHASDSTVAPPCLFLFLFESRATRWGRSLREMSASWRRTPNLVAGFWFVRYRACHCTPHLKLYLPSCVVRNITAVSCGIGWCHCGGKAIRSEDTKTLLWSLNHGGCLCTKPFDEETQLPPIHLAVAYKKLKSLKCMLETLDRKRADTGEVMYCRRQL